MVYQNTYTHRSFTDSLVISSQITKRLRISPVNFTDGAWKGAIWNYRLGARGT